MAEKTLTVSKEEAKVVAEIAVDGFDHIEFYVGNALQACYYYHHGFGFDILGFRGLETGERESASYVLRQDHVTIVLTSAMHPDSPIAHHVHQHGDGVKVIGLKVRDAKEAFDTVVARGAKVVHEPITTEDEHGTLVCAAVHTYGDTIHRLVERKNYKAFMPGFKNLHKPAASKIGLASIDHCVGNVEVGRMEDWVEFYKAVFGFHVYQQFDAKDISTQYSGLVSKVMSNKSGNIKLPLNEPSAGIRKSQIQEYLDYYLAPGVQHIAITTSDIIHTVAELKARGVEFLTVPRTYYDQLPERIGEIDEDLEELARLNILVDRDADGYLLQIFTKPVQDRPTLFFEVIQRKGCKGFGKGNFKALFESIERDQAKRGNL
jgi:4-hydroxyphenylpyruvate dioxygenase